MSGFCLISWKILSNHQIDQFGKAVKEIQTRNLSYGENTLTLDVSSLAAGIYLLKFRNDGFYQTKKLVIIR